LKKWRVTPKSPNLNHTPQRQPLNNEEWTNDFIILRLGKRYLDSQRRQSYPPDLAGRIVAEIAEKTKTTLPECNGRVYSAVKIVLNGECSCKDYSKAPSNWCKHRIAAGLAKRAHALTKQRLEQLDAASNGTTTPAPDQATTETLVPVPPQDPVATLALPEAPASVNFHTNIAGREVQITLRNTDETKLLAPLETLLQRFPVVAEPKEYVQQEGWCYKHNVPMKLNHGKRGSWWSHKLPNGQ
jgi:hypothetical protein